MISFVFIEVFLVENNRDPQALFSTTYANWSRIA
ncbi:unnamed protein product [Amoebophrya sp. A25]|nr:unnamed protein product [Amoebophrya sp. A25]|eukprot:GSA25T00006468001.1